MEAAKRCTRVAGSAEDPLLEGCTIDMFAATCLVWQCTSVMAAVTSTLAAKHSSKAQQQQQQQQQQLDPATRVHAGKLMQEQSVASHCTAKGQAAHALAALAGAGAEG